MMVHQYSLEITPDEFWEADKVNRVLRTKQRQIESTIGAFVPAGKCILTLAAISESIDWNFNFRGDQVNLKIPMETGKAIFLNDHFANSDNDIK